MVNLVNIITNINIDISMPAIAFSSMYILIELLVCLVSISMTYQTQLVSSITDKDLHHNNITVRFDNSTSVSKNRSFFLDVQQ